MEKELKIGFIGCGNVATALIGGILQSGYAPADILASDRIPSVRENKSAELGVRVISDNTEVVSFADVIFLCVKPQFYQEMLEEIPHWDFEDLCAVYRVDLSELGCPDSSMLVTSELLRHYGVTPEELHRDALHFAPMSHPASLRFLREIMAERCRQSAPYGMGGGPEILVATVKDGFSGAGVLLYPGVLDRAAERLGGSFYVLPSSVHELLFIEDNGDIHPEFLKEMVSAINAAHVAPQDRLTDSVYHYTAEEGLLEAV